jgi:hypothetical protein
MGFAADLDLDGGKIRVLGLLARRLGLAAHFRLVQQYVRAGRTGSGPGGMQLLSFVPGLVRPSDPAGGVASRQRPAWAARFSAGV